MAVTAAANALVALDEYKLLCGDVPSEPQYTLLINIASSRIERYTHRRLVAQDYEDTTALILDGSGRDVLLVPHYPLNSIEHLYVDTDRVFGVDTEIEAGDYLIKSESGLIVLYDDVFPADVASVKLECNAGYEDTSEAWPILQAACVETVRWMASRFSGFIGKRTETNGDGMSVGYEIELPLNVKGMIDDFVDRRI
jgi:hypothetical protein